MNDAGDEDAAEGSSSDAGVKEAERGVAMMTVDSDERNKHR